MNTDDLVKSDSFGLLPSPAARLFGAVAQLGETTPVDESAAAA